MHVTKVVDLVMQNLEQLSLCFSDFSIILNRFYKITDLNKKQELKSCKRAQKTCINLPGKVLGLAKWFLASVFMAQGCSSAMFR